MTRLYENGKLFVDLEWVRPDALRISGQDLDPPEFMGDEYEYWITVPREQLPALATALGVAAEKDAIMEAFLARGEEIVRTGERTWLADHGVETEFASYP